MDTESSQRLLLCALAHYEAREWQHAAEACRSVLRLDPFRPDVLILLLKCCQSGPAGEGAAASARLTVSAALDDARAAPERGLWHPPAAPADPGEEEECRRAMATDSSDVSARVRLAALCEKRGALEDTALHLESAARLQPDLPLISGYLGLLDYTRGQQERAVSRWTQAAGRPVALVPLLAGFGAVCLWARRLSLAIYYLEWTVQRRPDDPIVLSNLADACRLEGQFLKALRGYDRVIELGAASAETWYETGNALLAIGEYAQAAAAYRESLSAAEENSEAHQNLAVALYRLGEADEAVQQLRIAARDTGRLSAQMGLATIIPGSPAADHAAILAERRELAARLPETPEAERPPPPPQPDDSSRRLRVGYLSAFFDKPNYMMPVWGLINRHDRERLEIHLLSDVAPESIREGYIPHPADRVADIRNLDNQGLADKIRELEIDILVDLNGYSEPRRLALFRRRVAPVTLAWFNLYATSGLPGMDYLIGDEHVIGPEEECWYGERILRLPLSYLTFEVFHKAPPVAPPPALQNGFLTFGCLGTQYKITPAVLDAWARILAEAREARLLIANECLRSRFNREDYLLRKLAERGVATERVMLQGPAPHYEFLRKYDQCDLALDTFPYSGGTTTMEALWQGVPVLTFRGDRWVSRTSASLLANARLTEFVSPDVDSYVRRAVELANSPETPARLRELRATLREHVARSPACDTTALARHMEDLYQEAWRIRAPAAAAAG